MIFNALISGGGTKLAQGTVTAANKAVTVSGLSFTPNNVILLRMSNSSGGNNVFLWTFNTQGIRQGSTALQTITLTFADGGFTAETGATNTQFLSDYTWIAWKE